MNYILLLGANLGNATITFSKALQQISEFAEIELTSNLYSSEPWGFDSENTFTNQVVQVKSELEPEKFLDATQQVEIFLGRACKTQNGQYQSRTIDIDILFADNLIVDTPLLTIPHPLLHERRFALLPLTEHWSNLIHPKLGKTILQLFCECTDTCKVWREVK